MHALLHAQHLLTVIRARRRATSDRGASTIETVIIAASLAALALATMATITLLVDGKVAGIQL